MGKLVMVMEIEGHRISTSRWMSSITDNDELSGKDAVGNMGMKKNKRRMLLNM